MDKTRFSAYYVLNCKYMKIHLKIFLRERVWERVKGLIHFPIIQWTWLKLLTLPVESLSQFKISPFFLWSENWNLSSAVSLPLSRNFFQSRDGLSTWAAGEVHVGHEDSGPPQWSQLAPSSGQPSLVGSDSSGTRHKVPLVSVCERRGLLGTPVHDRRSQTARLLFSTRQKYLARARHYLRGRCTRVHPTVGGTSRHGTYSAASISRGSSSRV